MTIQAQRSIEILGLPATGKSFLVANCDVARGGQVAHPAIAAFRIPIALAVSLVAALLHLAGSSAPLSHRIHRARKIGRGLLKMAVCRLAVHEEGPLLWSAAAPWRRQQFLEVSVELLRITYRVLRCGIFILQIDDRTRHEQLKERGIVDLGATYHVGKATPRQQERQMDACVRRLIRPGKLEPRFCIIKVNEITDFACVCHRLHLFRCSAP